MTTAYGIGQRKSEQRIKLGTISVATLRGNEEELVEVMKMRDLCILALAETRLNGGEDSRYGVGFLVSNNLALMLKR